MKPVKLTAAGSRLAFCALVAITLGLASRGAQAQQDGDLELDKTRTNQIAEPTLNEGDTVRYRIRYFNRGPQPAANVDAQVVDDFDDTLLQDISWECEPQGGAGPLACPNPPGNQGGGDIDHPVQLDFDQGCICIVVATVRDCVVGELTNTASITPIAPDSDDDLSDNSDTISEPIVAVANIAVVKESGLETFECEDDETVTYQVIVTNNGPHCHPGVFLVDEQPDELKNMEWTCEGAACPVAAGAGDIEETFPLADGEQVIFTIDAELDLAEIDDDSDAVTNTAESVDVLNIDPNPENDVGSDTIALACAGTEVPTLPEVALIGLALALLAVGARRLRRSSLLS